jgi:hypothetical protein
LIATEPFSDQLERWLEGDTPKTVGAMSELFGAKSFGVAIVLLMFLPALPLPTGGVTHVFEVMTMLLAAQLMLGKRTIWVPARWRQRELGAASTAKAIPFALRRIRQVERFSHPRGAQLFAHRWMTRLLGLLVMAFAISAALAPPFSGLDTLPSVGAVLIGLSIILEDVVVLAVGIALGMGGVVLILTIGAALFRLIRSVI